MRHMGGHIAHRPEGSEDLVQDLQQGLLPTGGDVILGQLQEGQAILALTPHMLGRSKSTNQRAHDTD